LQVLRRKFSAAVKVSFCILTLFLLYLFFNQSLYILKTTTSIVTFLSPQHDVSFTATFLSGLLQTQTKTAFVLKEIYQ
jgi:ethanolamine utilization microcompartment shell protein EutL